MDLKEQTQNILKECVENILSACGLHTNDLIDAIVAKSLDEIEEVHTEKESKESMYDGMGVGKCCFCGDECNPQSQSC